MSTLSDLKDLNKADFVTLGVLSKVSGISIYTLRHYVRKGLLIPDSIGSNRYKYFDRAKACEILDFIVKAKRINFSLQDIYAILNMKGDTPCETVTSLLSQKIDCLEREIEHSQNILDYLKLKKDQMQNTPQCKDISKRTYQICALVSSLD